MFRVVFAFSCLHGVRCARCRRAAPAAEPHAEQNRKSSSRMPGTCGASPVKAATPSG